jgi:glycosyltransferase involved in cell wall biosynthesis
MPFFSIIIPTFNSEDTIHNCLSSVIHQTYNNFEIVVIDGSSKDNTVNIVKSFNNPNIFLLSEPDDGIYDAINKGIKLSKGDWFYILGSDDTFHDNNVLATIYRTANNTQSKIIYGNVKVIGNTMWAKDGEIHDGYFNLSKMLKKNICQQSIFYNYTIIQKLGCFNTKYKVCADWDFNLKCWANYTFQFVDVIVANFYAGKTSSHIKDHVYGEDKWKNIAGYFRWKLFNISFIKYIPTLSKIDSKKYDNLPLYLITNVYKLFNK